jgi:hypothetical protein
MRYYTYDKWNDMGYYVRKGEIAMRWNKKGVALFSEKQVEEKIIDKNDYGYDGDPMDYYN